MPKVPFFQSGPCGIPVFIPESWFILNPDPDPDPRKLLSKLGSASDGTVQKTFSAWGRGGSGPAAKSVCTSEQNSWERICVYLGSDICGTLGQALHSSSQRNTPPLP